MTYFLPIVLLVYLARATELSDAIELLNNAKNSTYVGGKELGYGTFAKVYEITDENTNTTRAIKLFKGNARIRTVQGEIDAIEVVSSLPTDNKLEKIVSQHLMTCSDCHFRGDEAPYFLEMPRVQGKALSKAFENFNSDDRIYVIYQTLLVVKYLSLFGLRHSDLKQKNIVVDKGKKITLIDYGGLVGPGLERKPQFTEKYAPMETRLLVYYYKKETPKESALLEEKLQEYTAEKLKSPDMFSIGVMMSRLLCHDESDILRFARRVNFQLRIFLINEGAEFLEPSATQCPFRRYAFPNKNSITLTDKDFGEDHTTPTGDDSIYECWVDLEEQEEPTEYEKEVAWLIGNMTMVDIDDRANIDEIMNSGIFAESHKRYIKQYM